MTFKDLQLSPLLLKALEEKGYITPSPIQQQAIPYALAGRDVLGCAQTGTGKTAAFALPIIQNLMKPSDKKHSKKVIRSLILTPTRELALQIAENLNEYGSHTQVRSAVIFGGVSANPQIKELRRGIDILVATPGRLNDLIGQGEISLSHVEIFVLDEADRMLDMGFSDDIMQIVKYLPKERQTIMFSATMPRKIQDLARTILHDPVEVKLAVSKPADKIVQSAYVCYEAQKVSLVKKLFAERPPHRVIIFASSKLKVKDMAIALGRAGFKVGAMHSDLEQQERDEVMYKFKAQQIDVLVATDIVARGIDIEDIGLVINYDVPHDPEDYIHRIGRTARAAATGSAVTFVSEDEQGKFHAIEKFIERDIRKAELPASVGAGPVYNPAVNNGRGRGGRGGGRGRGGSNGGSRGRGRADKGERAGRERRNDRERGAAAAENPGIAVPQAAPADNDHASGRGEGNRGTRDRKHRHRGGRNRRRGDKPQGGETPQPGGSVPRE